jgi:dTDP-4-dehydrorhamnose 3,5-epimerase
MRHQSKKDRQMTKLVTAGEMLPGLQIIEHKKHEDSRGNFCEQWKITNDNMRGPIQDGWPFRQLNTATSTRNVLRGMHRQNQFKRVMPLYGKIFDVALEPATGRWFGIELDENSGLLIPPQYAHGYLVLSDLAIVQYVVDRPYNKAEEENFNWKNYGIEWPIQGSPILSDKDAV